MNPKLLEDLKTATADLAHARRSLANAQFCQRHGMPDEHAFAVLAERSAYSRWLGFSEAFFRGR